MRRETAEMARWLGANRRALAVALRRVRRSLWAYAGTDAAGDRAETGVGAAAKQLEAEQPGAARDEGADEGDGHADADVEGTALHTLCEAFSLSPFERDVLLLCAGVELDSALRDACMAAQAVAGGQAPSFGLALAALPGAHWSATLPSGPLRQARLVELQGSVLQGALRTSEEVLHYLLGLQVLDDRIAALTQPMPARALETIVASQLAVVARLQALLADPGVLAGDQLIHLLGSDEDALQAVAAAACSAVGLQLVTMGAAAVPQAADDRETWCGVWRRSAVLHDLALMVCIGEEDPPAVVRAATALLRQSGTALFVCSRDPVRVAGRSCLQVELPVPTLAERRGQWLQVLGASAPHSIAAVEPLVSHFRLAPKEMAAAFQYARLTTPTPGELSAQLWDACRQQARPRLSDLAQRIEPKTTWDDLILPDPQMGILRAIAAQARHRVQIYDRWGFGARAQRGLGLSALFCGTSGTGKTLAAEVLAHDLRLDLYRIDLSQVVSKYIGETEKNLRRVFDAAEQGGAVLLFDEADALFGKRSEVKDSHDRYANIEVSYLLQRMEEYSGLSILTSNMKGALDSAFLRRIRFVVQFPFPDLAERARLWRLAFPSLAPTQDLQWDKLARLQVAGGNIRNIALTAAFLAADQGDAIAMRHVLAATRLECSKLEKALTDSEIGGWV